jgi:hypothetical protein
MAVDERQDVVSCALPNGPLERVGSAIGLPAGKDADDRASAGQLTPFAQANCSM